MAQKRRKCKLYEECKSHEYYRKTVGNWRCPFHNNVPKIKDMKRNKEIK